MFLTRSLRRKLVLGLALVGLMLSALIFSALVGMWSYGAVIHDLEYSIKSAPRMGDLHESLAALYQPLHDQPTSDAARRDRQQQWRQSLRHVRDEVHKFHNKLDRRPLRDLDMKQEFLRSFLSELESQLSQLNLASDGLLERDTHQKTASQMIHAISRLQSFARELPSLDEGLEQRLTSAREVYRWCVSVLIGSGVIVLGLLVGLIRCGYAWIFVPIRQLHHGFSTVAQGNFDYRVHLRGRDEMVEMAEAFNRMVARFQEIKSQLDNEVAQRSKQLVRSERLADVGILAAGVAHEINNPLAAISLAAESLESRLMEYGSSEPQLVITAEDRQVLHDYLGMIQKEAYRCRGITTRLLDFARVQDSLRARQDVVPIVSEVLDLAGHLWKSRGFQVEFNRRQECYFEFNAPEIKQVVLNLVTNALESLEGPQGRLSIGVSESPDEVVLTFRDNGCGMTPRVREHLFEPFFTEKKSGKGTGLGLSITHRIVSDHGGRIEVYSDGPGTGSEFQVHFPKRPAAVLRPTLPAAAIPA